MNDDQRLREIFCRVLDLPIVYTGSFESKNEIGALTTTWWEIFFEIGKLKERVHGHEENAMEPKYSDGAAKTSDLPPAFKYAQYTTDNSIDTDLLNIKTSDYLGGAAPSAKSTV